MKKWLFFDLGSTLIDESSCEEYRRRIRNERPGAIIPWPGHLEKLYPDVPGMLAALSGRWNLGIIANQAPCLRKRLADFGILGYFGVIAASGDDGVSKPDPGLFRIALERACCHPGDAWMLGDRVDNDIIPAARLGMNTAWIRQGIHRNAHEFPPDITPTLIFETIGQAYDYFAKSTPQET